LILTPFQQWGITQPLLFSNNSQAIKTIIKTVARLHSTLGQVKLQRQQIQNNKAWLTSYKLLKASLILISPQARPPLQPPLNPPARSTWSTNPNKNPWMICSTRNPTASKSRSKRRPTRSRTSWTNSSVKLHSKHKRGKAAEL
jgi:hypothetical protein